jgi:hypothetical protein
VRGAKRGRARVISDTRRSGSGRDRTSGTPAVRRLRGRGPSQRAAAAWWGPNSMRRCFTRPKVRSTSFFARTSEVIAFRETPTMSLSRMSSSSTSKSSRIHGAWNLFWCQGGWREGPPRSQTMGSESVADVPEHLWGLCVSATLSKAADRSGPARRGGPRVPTGRRCPGREAASDLGRGGDRAGGLGGRAQHRTRSGRVDCRA